jgi:hypothetical protein
MHKYCCASRTKKDLGPLARLVKTRVQTPTLEERLAEEVPDDLPESEYVEVSVERPAVEPKKMKPPVFLKLPAAKVPPANPPASKPPVAKLPAAKLPVLKPPARKSSVPKAPAVDLPVVKPRVELPPVKTPPAPVEVPPVKASPPPLDNIPAVIIDDAPEEPFVGVEGVLAGRMDSWKAVIFEHLLARLRLPCDVNAGENFRWEESYASGDLDQREYERLRKDRPSFRDRFELLEIIRQARSPWMSSSGIDIAAQVRRKLDGQKFVVGLSDISLADKKLPQHEIISDYAAWFRRHFS